MLIPLTCFPHSGGNANGQLYHLKILVPAVAAGAIIGKGGETIGQLQKETNARVKMSKANDFYPGTPSLQQGVMRVVNDCNQCRSLSQEPLNESVSFRAPSKESFE